MKSKSIDIYRRILTYALPYRSRMFTALICMILVSICAMVPPWLMKNVVDDVLIEKNMFMLNIVAFSLVGVYLVRGFASYGQKYLMAWVGQRVVLDLRVQAYEAMQSMSLKYIHGKRVGELLSRVTNDATVLQNTVTNSLVDLIVQSFTTFGMLAFLVYINWRLTVITFLVLPPTVWIISGASRKLRNVGHDIQENLAGLSALAEEALAAIRIVRSFATEKEEVKRFQDQNLLNFKSLMRGTQVNGILASAIDLILISVLAGIFWLGGRSVIDGKMTPGELIAFLGYLGFMAHPVTVLTRVISQLQHGLAAAERIFSLLDHEETIKIAENPVHIDNMEGHIQFEDLSFRYDKKDKWVLKDLNLDVPSGTTVAIVGPTGTGKSTLVDLVQRFYDPETGLVRIDGYNIKDLDLSSLRRQIGIVPQDPVLMKGSFRYNIAYGCKDATEEDVRKAASIAEISSYIESLPDGYDTEIGERGITLSGGQRQRVAIARAIVRDPRIIIMDEATSSLDAEVERQIQKAMDRAMEGRTSLVIAHRLSTIRNADKIVYLEGGRIVEEGSHEDLLEAKGLYSKLHSIQSGEDYDKVHK